MTIPRKDTDPGFCPFCDCKGWEICDHFVGYLQSTNVERSQLALRHLGGNEATVDTGVSIRVYSKEGKKRLGPVTQFGAVKRFR
jgi:hypothetical protein